jgi:hypothetical protein
MNFRDHAAKHGSRPAPADVDDEVTPAVAGCCYGLADD